MISYGTQCVQDVFEFYISQVLYCIDSLFSYIIVYWFLSCAVLFRRGIGARIFICYAGSDRGRVNQTLAFMERSVNKAFWQNHMSTYLIMHSTFDVRIWIKTLNIYFSVVDINGTCNARIFCKHEENIFVNWRSSSRNVIRFHQ